MPVTVKAGVVLEGVDLERMSPAVQAVQEVWSSYGVPAVITSAVREASSDSGARGNSLHVAGLAIDFRVKNLPRDSWTEAAQAVAGELDPALYDVVLEIDRSVPVSDARNRSHLHIEFDPQPAKLTRPTGYSEVFI